MSCAPDGSAAEMNASRMIASEKYERRKSRETLIFMCPPEKQQMADSERAQARNALGDPVRAAI